MSERQAIDELRAEVDRLTAMRDNLLRTMAEQGEARAKDYETTRDVLGELVWRRKEMGDPPHGQHDFQRPGSGVERRCVRCEIPYSEWLGTTSCPAP